MKNTIQISTDIIQVSISIQGGLIPDITLKDLIDKDNYLIVDKDVLLESIVKQLGYKLDWEENIIETNKGYYNTQEFLIKLISNGRKYLKKLPYQTL